MEDEEQGHPAGEEASAEVTAGETPADEIPADETPADETPAEETPVEESPEEVAPVAGTPAEEVPAERPPAQGNLEKDQVEEQLSRVTETFPPPSSAEEEDPKNINPPHQFDEQEYPTYNLEEEEENEMDICEGAKLLPEEEKRLKKVYDELVLKIVTQNNILTKLKESIRQRCKKCPRTACEDREICNLKICCEKENLKLLCLVKNAMGIQSQYPDCKWPPIPLETTIDEDCMPIRVNYNAMATCFPRNNETIEVTPRQQDTGPHKCSSNSSSSEDSWKKVTQAQQKRLSSQYNKELSRSYNMQEKLVADNADLEGDRYKLQQELLSRDRMVECLQQKMGLMHTELSKLCRKSHGPQKKDRRSYLDEIPNLQSRVKEQGSSTKCLASAMDRIQNALDCLKFELESVKKSKERSNEYNSQKKEQSGGKYSSKNELQEIQKRYYELLEDYAMKERELADLKEKVNGFFEGGISNQNKGDDHRDAEIRLLRQKLKECREEQDEFKVIISEQSRQTDDYREKYMASLQKIEELKCILQKMEVDNKHVEEQINLEIQRIKDKFQEKLQQWAHLPEMLENEQIKLSQCCKERDDLEAKLRIVCRELKALKCQRAASSQVGDEKDDPDKLRRSEEELANLQSKYETLSECKNRLCEKFDKVKTELDCLRQESAKIICRLKERAQTNQATLQKHIDELEHDLAQCRATACLSIADREGIIKDMQAQLNCLSLSFDSSQKQIKSLKDHMAYMSNGKNEFGCNILPK